MQSSVGLWNALLPQQLLEEDLLLSRWLRPSTETISSALAVAKWEQLFCQVGVDILGVWMNTLEMMWVFSVGVSLRVKFSVIEITKTEEMQANWGKHEAAVLGSGWMGAYICINSAGRLSDTQSLQLPLEAAASILTFHM